MKPVKFGRFYTFGAVFCAAIALSGTVALADEFGDAQSCLDTRIAAKAVDVALSLFSRAALPAALFGLGGILVRYSLTERLGEIAMVCVIRLFVHPGIAYVMSHMVFGLSLEFVRAAVIAAAMAPGVNAFIFANMYDRAKGTAASVVLIGTVASIFSVSLWLLILGH